MRSRSSGGRSWRTPEPRRAECALLVQDDAAARDDGRRVAVVGCAHLIVVDDVAAGVPDLDPELVRPAAAVHLPVDRGQQEAVPGAPVGRAGPFVLPPGAGNEEPL